MNCKKKLVVFLLLLFILFSALNIYAEDNIDSFKEQVSFLNDYIHKDNTITEEAIRDASATSSGWIGPGRSAINSAIGFFNKGDTVEVYSFDGVYQGTFNVFAVSNVKNNSRNISYKLLKPHFIPYNTTLPLRIGYTVQKKFALTINLLYSGLFSSNYGMVHSAEAQISFPKVFQPVTLTFGPVMYNVTTTSDILLGGAIGVLYRLPLDYMAKIITNLNFIFSFRFVMATSLKDGDKFNYGYSWDIGARWYFAKFMGISFSFNMAGLFRSSNSSAVFNNLGFNTGLCIEI